MLYKLSLGAKQRCSLFDAVLEKNTVQVVSAGSYVSAFLHWYGNKDTQMCPKTQKRSTYNTTLDLRSM
jgi:hypothetical protein